MRPRDEVMAGIVLAEARRKLLAFGIDKLEQPHAKVPLEVRQLLAKWLRASQLVEQVGDEGLEPPTSGVSCRRSDQLS